MGYNQIIYDGNPLIDLTQDTVTEENLLNGITAHNAAGDPIVGRMESGGSGNTPVERKDVNFVDYDGTIRYSYTAAEFAALSALPASPTHSGLTSQGWNWSLSDAQAYAANYGKLWIGQMYITDDGKTRIYIHLEEGRTSPMLGCCPNGTVTVDWGDGTAPDTLTGTSISSVKWTSNHAYASPGDYVITLTVSGSVGFTGSSSSNAYSNLLRYSSSADMRNTVYRNAIRKIEIGVGVTSIRNYAFYYCKSLSGITLPSGVTTIGTSAFSYCYSLSGITLPSGVTTIGNSAFSYCQSLSGITLPSGVTNIGTGAFSSCYSLSGITLPSGVTTIGNSVFNYCQSLSGIILPSGVTSIEKSAFSYCQSLSGITLPSGVTSIGDNAFIKCEGIALFDFRNHISVPTLSSISAFSNIPDDFKIIVPSSLYDEWIAATNWSTYASEIVAV